ncbi:AMP-binding enzyme family protein, partial [Mycobacterium kansasii]
MRFVTDKSWDGAMSTRDLSYAELSRLAARFTAVLRALGINKGYRVFTIMGRIPELYITMLGALRNGSVVSPLFSAFGPEPIATRVEIGQADVLVTTKAIYQRKIAKIRDRLTSVRHVLVVDDDKSGEQLPGTLNFWDWMTAADENTRSSRPPPTTRPYCTSPVAPRAPPRAPSMSTAPSRCTMSPAATHSIFIPTTSIGAQLIPMGHRNVVRHHQSPAARRDVGCRRSGVRRRTVVPDTAGPKCLGLVHRTDRIRMLIKAGPNLRGTIASPAAVHRQCGRTTQSEAVWWENGCWAYRFTTIGGKPKPVDHDRQHAAFDIKPGSMGGRTWVDAYIVHQNDDGSTSVIEEPDVEGELALKPGWPSMFRGYLHAEDRYRKCFSDGLYLTGDLAKKDADGYF